MASYPNTVWSPSTKTTSQIIAASHVNDAQDEIVAIEGALLTSGLTLTSGQVVFPAVQNASSNANTLDDYEEGTWTVTVAGDSTAGSNTYTNQETRYIKIGSMVWAAGYVVINSKDAAMAGSVYISLPITAETGALQFYAGTVSWTGLASSFVTMTAVALQNTTRLHLYGLAAAATALYGTPVTAAAVQDGSGFIFSVVYRAAS